MRLQDSSRPASRPLRASGCRAAGGQGFRANDYSRCFGRQHKPLLSNYSIREGRSERRVQNLKRIPNRRDEIRDGCRSSHRGGRRREVVLRCLANNRVHSFGRQRIRDRFHDIPTATTPAAPSPLGARCRAFCRSAARANRRHLSDVQWPRLSGVLSCLRTTGRLSGSQVP